MTYNIHPLFVHFPIALLLVYSVIKILPLKKWFPRVSWAPTEFVLLLLGVLSAFVASSTGEMAEQIADVNKQLVETHSFFADLSTFIYGALLLGEILKLITPTFIPKVGLAKINPLLIKIQKILTNNILSVLLAIVGLVAISITGLLGGVMVFGVSADPIAPLVLKMLGITY